MRIKCYSNLVLKTQSTTGKKLKDLNTKQEKEAELAGRFFINDAITVPGEMNALLVDDLFDSGASMEAATKALRTCKSLTEKELSEVSQL